MAVKVDIKYGCGCGFSTRDVDRAAAHCKSTSHTLSISGTVGLEVESKATKPTRRAAALREPAKTEEFENLREKLKGG